MLRLGWPFLAVAGRLLPVRLGSERLASCHAEAFSCIVFSCVILASHAREHFLKLFNTSLLWSLILWYDLGGRQGRNFTNVLHFGATEAEK